MERGIIRKSFGFLNMFILLVIVTMPSCRKHVADDQDETPVTRGRTPTPPPPPAIPTLDVSTISAEINPAIKGYMLGLPKDYASRQDSFPTIIFFHGLGQMGNGSTDLKYLLNDGMGKLLTSGKFPAVFKVKGVNYSFVVACPQMDTTASIEEAESFISYVLQTYRANPKRLYIIGMSFGARLATRVAAGRAGSYAALIPISGVPINPGIETRCQNIAAANLPVWAFHNDEDPVSNIQDATDFIRMITELNPSVLPKFTVFNVYGHDAWTQALDPDYREDGKNIYEWMLGYSR